MIGAAPARGPLARVNPVAKLACALLIALPLIVTIDVVSAGAALLLEIPLLAMAGLSWRGFAKRTIAVWIAAPLTALTILLYGAPSGETHLRFLLVHVTDGSMALALATLLRVLAIALPAVVLFAGVDATDLADGLAQRVRLPARFVLGALGGMRLVGLLANDWRELESARRARGVADEGRIRRLVGMGFALVVLAIRRGSHLATAMEARAFGSDAPRTWARESPWGAREWIVTAAGLAVSGSALVAAVVAGTFSPIVG